MLALATHALCSPQALERLPASDLSELLVTDTVAFPPPQAAKPTVLSVAPLLAETIANVFAESSVSALFSGHETF